MKTAEQTYKKFYHLDEQGELTNSDIEIVQCMEEYASQFKSNKLFEFVYCGMTEESSYATISLHRTREGAEKAMNKHKEEACKEWKKKYPVGSYEPFPFGRFEDWGINEVEIQY